MNLITIVIAEDHPEVLSGLLTLLKPEPDLQVIGEVANGEQAVEAVLRLHPNVVLMDVTMPILNGLEATRQILGALSSTKVIMLSSHTDEAYIYQARLLGAAGYLVKQSDAKRLPEVIRNAYNGAQFIYPTKTNRN